MYSAVQLRAISEADKYNNDVDLANAFEDGFMKCYEIFNQSERLNVAVAEKRKENTRRNED